MVTQKYPTVRRFRVISFLIGIVVGGAVALALAAWSGDAADDGSMPPAASRKTTTLSRETPAGGGGAELSPQLAFAGLEETLFASDESIKESDRNGMIDRASSFDARGSFEIALGLTDLGRSRDALQRVLRTWIVEDREAALVAIEQVGNVALRRDLLRSAVGSLSRSDPEGAVAILRATPWLRDDGLWQESFSTWAKADAPAAIAAWRGLDHSEEQRDALRGIASALVREDLSAAISWAGDLTGDEKEDTLYAVFRQAAGTNPVLAANHLDLLEGDSAQVMQVIGSIAEEWAEGDPAGALAWAGDLPAGQRERAMGEIASELVRVDPDAAEEIARGIGDTVERHKLIGDLARLHMQVDSAEAISWIRELPFQDQLAAWRSAAYEWSRTRPEEAAAFAVSGEVDPEVRQRLLESSMPQWARNDPAAAADWALAVPGDEGATALARVVGEWSQRDPEAAIGFLAENTEGEQFDRMMRRAVNSWSYYRPQEAAEFASGLEPGEATAAIFRDVTDRWMRVDSLAASEWVAALEPSEERDSAVSSLIVRIERTDLEAAFAWADTISDEKRRDETKRRLNRRLDGR